MVTFVFIVQQLIVIDVSYAWRPPWLGLRPRSSFPLTLIFYNSSSSTRDSIYFIVKYKGTNSAVSRFPKFISPSKKYGLFESQWGGAWLIF